MPPIQWMSLIVAFFVLVICFLRLKLSPQKRLIRYVIMSLMLHVIVFYGFVLLKDFNLYIPSGDHLDFSGWSSILRFHSLTTIALIEGYGYWRDRWNRIS